MSPKEFCHLIAHGAASEFLRLQIEKPDTETVGVAILDIAGVRIVVSMTRYDGPAQLHLTSEGAAQLGLPQHPPAIESLRDIEKEIFAAAPANHQKPMTVKAIARRTKSKYGYNTHFRESVRRLIEKGFLERIPGGVRRAA
jgi:hypothetical protein